MCRALNNYPDVGPAHALPRVNITVVVVSAAGVTVARLAAQRLRLGKSVVLGKALVAVPCPGDISLACTCAALLVTAPVLRLNCSVDVTCALLTTVRVFRGEVPIA